MALTIENVRKSIERGFFVFSATSQEMKLLQQEGFYVIATHDGASHADDVFACATLKLLREKEGTQNLIIIRTKDEKAISGADAVIDVGKICDPGKDRFDHHQENGAGKRPSGTPFAAFGLVWRFYGMSLIRKYLDDKKYQAVSKDDAMDIWERVDNQLVEAIDAYDCGKEMDSDFHFGELIAYLRPTFLEREMKTQKLPNTVFQEFCEIAELVIKRYIAQTHSAKEIEKRIQEVLKVNNPVLILDFAIRMSEIDPVLKNTFPDIQFVIIDQNPKKGDTWTINIPRGKKSSFPSAWYGKKGEEFANICGLQDVDFCHPLGFTLTCKSKETALALVKMCNLAH